MSDLISRQAAIKIASGFCHPANIAKELAKLPSAQPEIIHCRDCTYRDGDYCHRYHDGYSAFIHLDDFCNYAERRTDE